VRSEAISAYRTAYCLPKRRTHQDKASGNGCISQLIVYGLFAILTFALGPHLLRAQGLQYGPALTGDVHLAPEAREIVPTHVGAPKTMPPVSPLILKLNSSTVLAAGVQEKPEQPESQATMMPSVASGNTLEKRKAHFARAAEFLGGLVAGILLMLVTFIVKKQRNVTAVKETPGEASPAPIQDSPASQEAIVVARDMSEMDEQGSENGYVEQVEVRLGGIRCVCLEPWTYTLKNDDRVFTGVIAKRYPAVLVADGASNCNVPGTGEVSGGGGEASEIASATLITGLELLLTEDSRPISLEILLSRMADLVLKAEEDLREHNKTTDRPGATTLLFAFLYATGATMRDNLYWVYGYIGDGEIVVVSPSRTIRNWPCETLLVTPHSLGDSPVMLPRSEVHRGFAPVTGIVPYQSGDILYVASDGLEFVSKFLRKSRKLTFGKYAWKESLQHLSADVTELRLPDPIKQFEEEGIKAYDDITVGAIWTEQQACSGFGDTDEKDQGG